MLRSLLAVAAIGRAAANGRHDASGHVIAGLAQEELAVTDSGRLGDRAPSYAFWSIESATKVRKNGVPLRGRN